MSSKLEVIYLEVIYYSERQCVHTYEFSVNDSPSTDIHTHVKFCYGFAEQRISVQDSNVNVQTMYILST